VIANIVYGVAFVLTAASIVALYVCWDSVTATRNAFTPAEQMRERTPWPPPPLTQDTGWVTVVYDKPPRREPLALPRGDR